MQIEALCVINLGGIHKLIIVEYLTDNLLFAILMFPETKLYQ